MLSFFKLLSRKGARALDPLHVSMTGVRMGERFLQIGCDDKALLAGLAAKVGLSGAAAVAAFDDASAARATQIGARVGALIDVQRASGGTLPVDADSVDMVVVDDTGGAFQSQTGDMRVALLREARRIVRAGGRIEIVQAEKNDYDFTRDLAEVGFKPVRVLAERDGFRFIEGLKA